MDKSPIYTPTKNLSMALASEAADLLVGAIQKDRV
jgi:hypothetical protein